MERSCSSISAAVSALTAIRALCVGKIGAGTDVSVRLKDVFAAIGTAKMRFVLPHRSALAPSACRGGNVALVNSIHAPIAFHVDARD